MKYITLCVITFFGALVFLAPIAHADMIEASEIVAIPAGVTPSGNGTLDIKMFTSETADNKENGPPSTSLNVDDGNISLPKGLGNVDTGSYIESYITSAGEIQAFYDLNFGDNVIDEMVIFLDLNETKDHGPANHFERMDIILNPDMFDLSGNPILPDPINPNPAGLNNNDVSSAEQAAINQVYVGGTKIAWLDPTILTGGPPAFYNLPLNVQGAGFADYAIFTGINPYDLDSADVLLFNQSISFLSNGGETKFLSGDYSGDDICIPGTPDCPDEIPTPVPEPATMLLLGTGLVGVAGAARRRKKNQA